MTLASTYIKPFLKAFWALFTFGLLFSGFIMLIYHGSSHSYQAFGAEKKQTSLKWTCPMHPHYIAEEAGTCPICGMDLVKLQGEPEKTQNSDGSGRTIITIPIETIQKMGVRIAKAEPSIYGKRTRSFGIIQENERLQTELSARVEGWIETLKITAVGDHVNKGDVLFEIFSPELIVSQRDYIIALSQSKTDKSNITRRLLSFGVQQKALDLIAEKMEVQQKLPFYATQPGTISELNVTPGSYVRKGMTIAKIQDYSEVWVMVNVSEKDMGFLSKGTAATIYFPSLPGKSVNTIVDYIYPEVDIKTRTGRVRLVVQNETGELRPGTYVDVVFETEISDRLSVPSEAVLKDESGDYVVLSLGEGRFLSKEVKLGLVTDGRAEIKAGLEAGDKIVVSSQFLLDSESALRESFRKLERLQLPLDQLRLSKTDVAKFDHIVDAALYLHESLNDGFAVDEKFLEPAAAIKNIMWSDYKNTKLAGVLTDSQNALKRAQKAKTKTDIREALNQIIKALEPWLLSGAPSHYKEKGLLFYQTSGSKQKWLQQKLPAANPYNKETAELIAWPNKAMRSEKQRSDMPAPEKQDASEKNNMRGSHGQ